MIGSCAHCGSPTSSSYTLESGRVIVACSHLHASNLGKVRVMDVLDRCSDGTVPGDRSIGIDALVIERIRAEEE